MVAVLCDQPYVVCEFELLRFHGIDVQTASLAKEFSLISPTPELIVFAG